MDYWSKQTDKPLFPEILWSRPENRLGAGRLSIVGGNAHGIAAPANAFQAAVDAGIGSCRVVLPEHVKKSFGKIFQEAYFAPSNPSGGFSKSAMDELIAQSYWSEGVLLAGDFGHNSETSALIETYLTKYDGPVTLTQDAVECCYGFVDKLLERRQTLLVLSFAQAQKILRLQGSQIALEYSMPMMRLVKALHEFTKNIDTLICIRLVEHIFLGQKGRVITTKAPEDKVWRVKAAAKASVWWLQNPGKQLEATATSLLLK